MTEEDITEADITDQAWLGGQLQLLQPKTGYRVAIDAALLAAATPLLPGERALDMGTGVAAAALALAKRIPEGKVDGIELQPLLASLGAQNIARNGMSDRVRCIPGDILAPPTVASAYDHVCLNPPYLTPEDNAPSANAMKRIATVEGPARLADWLATAVNALKPGGSLTIIHRADRLGDILGELSPLGVGGAIVYPLWPKAGVAAHRIIVQARKARGGRMLLTPGLVLHQADGAFTAAADKALRGGALELRPHAG